MAQAAGRDRPPQQLISQVPPQEDQREGIGVQVPSSTVISLAGRRRPPIQFGQQQRVWYLWVPSLAITVLLALGIAVFVYPGIRWEALTPGPDLLRVLPPVCLGLFCLVLLEALYILSRVRETRGLREYILATSGEAAFVVPQYPRDGLTGAWDRRALPELLKRESTWVDRYHLPLCVALCDIRGFSKFNERQGNMAGDLVLKDFARALQTTVRQTDSVLRYGADEFLCLLPRTDSAGGAAFVRRVQQALQRSARLRDVQLDVGLAVYEAGRDVNLTLTSAENDLRSRRA